MPPEGWAFKSASEFMERRPGYDRSILEKVIGRSQEVQPMEKELRETWEEMKEDGREMLLLAVMLTKTLGIPANRLRPIMQTLRESIG